MASAGGGFAVIEVVVTLEMAAVTSLSSRGGVRFVLMTSSVFLGLGVAGMVLWCALAQSFKWVAIGLLVLAVLVGCLFVLNGMLLRSRKVDFLAKAQPQS